MATTMYPVDKLVCSGKSWALRRGIPNHEISVFRVGDHAHVINCMFDMANLAAVVTDTTRSGTGYSTHVEPTNQCLICEPAPVAEAAPEVYAQWTNYAGQTVTEYVDGTRTVDGVTAPKCDAPVWPGSTTAVFDAWRADGVARAVPLWAVIDTAGVTDSEGFVSTCSGCDDMWPNERLDCDTFWCPLCLAAEAAEWELTTNS